MNKKSIGLIFAALAVFGASVIWFKLEYANQKIAALPQLSRAVDFSLTDQRGTPFALADLRGKVWIGSLMFTRCMGQCPLMINELKKLHAALPDVTFVSFTSDPVYDTPARLAAYAEARGAASDRWHFLSGSADTIDSVSESFLFGKIAEPSAHSLRFVLVDREGGMRGAYDSQDPEAMQRLRRDAELLAG